MRPSDPILLLYRFILMNHVSVLQHLVRFDLKHRIDGARHHSRLVDRFHLSEMSTEPLSVCSWLRYTVYVVHYVRTKASHMPPTDWAYVSS